MRALAGLLLSAAVCGAAPVPKPTPPDPTGFGYLGVRATDSGALIIEEPEPTSPAGRGGLRGGDKLLKIGPVKPKSFNDIRYFVGSQRPGTAVRVTVLRNEAEATVTVILGNMPEDILETYRQGRATELAKAAGDISP